MEILKEHVFKGKAPAAADRTRLLLNQGGNPETIVREALIPAMDQVGLLVQAGEYYIPDMLVAARAMQACMDILRPALAGIELKPAGKVVIGTVQGDLHDIGKNLAKLILEGAGFAVIDLGNDVSPEAFIQAVEKEKPDILGLSALLTTTMVSMQDTVEAVKKAGLCNRVKIIIGGAPVTPEFADVIGADFYAVDATAGREYARSVMKA